MSIVSWFTRFFYPPSSSFPFNKFPADMMVHTFSFLTGKEFARSFRVCKLWQSLIEKNERMWNLSPPQAFGHKEWISYGIGDPGRAPMLPPSTFETLQHTCHFWPNEKAEANHALVFVSPKTKKDNVDYSGAIGDFNNLVHKSNQDIGGQELSLELCIALAQNPTFNNIKKPYWFLITHDVIPGSKGKTFEEQEKILESEGYSVPRAIEVMVLVYAEYLRTKKELLNSELTRCGGFFNGERLVMGKFAKKTGLVIDGEKVTDQPGMLGVKRFE